MYYSRILSKRALGSIIAAAPDNAWRLDEMARQVLAVLHAEMAEPTVSRVINTGGEDCWTMIVGQIAALIPGGPTPHFVGRVLRDMGLETYHTRNGNVVLWNDAQVDILDRELEATK